MARAVALLLALTVAASGSGLPMCVSLLARAAEPCAMHQHERGGHHTHGAQVAPAHDMDDACHTSDGNVGCAAGGSCPASGTAAPVGGAPLLSSFGPILGVGRALEPFAHSFVAPPAPPPPQA